MKELGKKSDENLLRNHIFKDQIIQTGSSLFKPVLDWYHLYFKYS